jgi:hypothetical protein
MPLGHSVGFWGSSVPSVAQFIAARSLSVPGSLTEPTGAQPGDRSYIITRGAHVNGSNVPQSASSVTPPTGWSLYAWNSGDYDYVVFTKVRGASADGPMTVMADTFITTGSAKIAAGSDWSANAATWAVVRGTTVAGNSGGHLEDDATTAESLAGSGSLEVYGVLGGYQLNTASGWTKVHEYLTGEDIGTWFTRDNPPNPTGVSTFTHVGGGGGQAFDLHLILSA